VEAELFHADGRMYGQTDMANRIVAFRNFTDASKKKYIADISQREYIMLPFLYGC